MTEAVPPTLTSTTTLADGTAVVVLAGEIDVATHEQFTAALLDAADAARTVTVDLRAVTFFDSSAVSALLIARGTIGEAGGALVVGETSDVVRRTLEIVGLYELVRGAGDPPPG